MRRRFRRLGEARVAGPRLAAPWPSMLVGCPPHAPEFGPKTQGERSGHPKPRTDGVPTARSRIWTKNARRTQRASQAPYSAGLTTEPPPDSPVLITHRTQPPATRSGPCRTSQARPIGSRGAVRRCSPPTGLVTIHRDPCSNSACRLGMPTRHADSEFRLGMPTRNPLDSSRSAETNNNWQCSNWACRLEMPNRNADSPASG